MSAKVYNFRGPVYKGVPLPWDNVNEMKPNVKRYTTVKRFTFWKVDVKLYNCRVFVDKGVRLPWEKCNPSFDDQWWPSIRLWKVWKVSVNLYNFRVPDYKGVPLPWMKWHPCFNDDWWPIIRVWKVLLSEKWVLNYSTLGFPFISGFPFHVWNKTDPSKMTFGQVWDHANFHFLKSEC